MNHITLETGDFGIIPKPSGDDAARAMLASLAKGQPADIPGYPDWQLKGAQEQGKGLSVLLMRTIDGKRAPVAWFCVATDPAYGAMLWRQMHTIGLPPDGLATNPDRQPALPWLGTRMMAGAMLCAPDDLTWIAGLSQAIAWAWISEPMAG